MLKNELIIFFPSKDYFVSDEIKGYAELRIPYTLDVFAVSAKLFGVEQINIKSKTQTNVFFEKELILTGDGSKDRGYDWLGRRKKESTTLKQGPHQYPFQFVLPSHLPPSSETNEAKIRYVLEVTAESGNTKMQNLVSASLIKVSGSIFDLNFIGNNNNPFTVKETKTWFMTSKQFEVVVNLESKVFIPGDSIKMKFGLDNQTSKGLTKMSMTLVEKTEYFHGGFLIDEKEESLAVLPLGGLNAYEQKFPAQQLLIPTTANESLALTDMGDGKKVGKCIHYVHSLVFYAEPAGILGSEVKFTIPIYICKTVKPQVTTTSGSNVSSAPSFTDYQTESFYQAPVNQQTQQSMNPQVIQQQQQQPQQQYQGQVHPQYQGPQQGMTGTTGMTQSDQVPTSNLYDLNFNTHTNVYSTPQNLYPQIDLVPQEQVAKKKPPPIPNDLKQPSYDEFFK